MAAAPTQTEPSADTPPRVFYGWKVAGAAAVIQCLQNLLILQAFGNYAVVLREQFGWSRTTISIAYTFNRAESGLLGPLHGWALARHGSKRVMRVGVAFLLVGFLWFSQISTPIGFILSFFVIAVGAGLSGFMTITTEMVQWFERKRARALSTVQLGMAAGGLLIPLLVFSLRQLGWRETAIISGLVISAVVYVASSMFGTSPVKRGEPVDGIDPDLAPFGLRPSVASRYHFTASQAMRTRAFWLLALGHMSALLVVGSVLAHLSLFLTSEQGYSLQQASFVMGAIPLAQIAGMAIGGVIGDRRNKRKLCAIAMVGHVTGLLLLTFATTPLMIWGFVVLHGVAWGMRGPLMAAIRADYFGSTSFGQIMGYTSVVLMFGMIGGPLLAGILADVTGSYQLGFTVLAGLATSGAAFFLLATPPAPPPDTESPTV